MRNLSLSLLALAAFALTSVGCLGVDPPEGHLACTTAAQCPATWVCRADSRCWRTADGTVDGGMHDTGTQPDVGMIDGAMLDMGMPDTGMDAGPHDGGPDAGMPDVGPGEDSGIDGGFECLTSADCDDSDMCTDDSCTTARSCMHAVHSCSDSIACTTDMCSAATGCSHVNDDAVCGAGRTCAPTDASRDANGCIVAPACLTDANCDDGLFCTDDHCAITSCTHTAHPCSSDTNLCTVPAMCDETMNACVEPFDPSSVSDTSHCGASAASCMGMCTATHATRVATCSVGVCGEACAAGRVDVDGLASNGCECMISGTGDAPDDAAADANCDGADGVIGTTVYVTTAGAGTHTGTSPANAATLVEAFAIAHSSTRHQLLVASGDYMISTTLTTVDAMTIFGGYAADFRSRSGVSRVVATSASALALVNMTSVTIDSVNWATTARTAAGETAHTIDLSHSTGVTLRRLTVTAGDGAPGLAGTDGAAGAPGGNGGNGGGATGGASAGVGGTTSGGGGGGGAGGGIVGGTTLQRGFPGLDATSVGAGCGHGNTSMGMISNIPTTCITSNGGDGFDGEPGCAGGAGSRGGGGLAPGALIGGAWVAQAAGNGTNGSMGGGGGGASGGGAARCNSNYAAGGGGGAGGSGGTGGIGGRAGGAGGASIAILVDASTFTLDQVTVQAGNGGAGGAGGNGGVGGAGGSGGGGGRGGMTGTASGGGGGRGGPGAPGGSGGCGGSGAGGDSYAVVGNAGSSLTVVASTLTHGAGGAGGAVCSSGVGSAGATGAAIDRSGL